MAKKPCLPIEEKRGARLKTWGVDIVIRYPMGASRRIKYPDAKLWMEQGDRTGRGETVHVHDALARLVSREGGKGVSGSRFSPEMKIP